LPGFSIVPRRATSRSLTSTVERSADAGSRRAETVG
jgi:hypothetical protein